MVHVRPRLFDHKLAEFAGTRHLRFPNQRRSLRHQYQEQSGLGLMSGEMFGGEIMLAFAGRTVHDRDLILFRPSPQTAAEAPRHAHQMSIVEIFIRTIQGAPPEAKAPAKLPPPEVCVQDHAIDAIVTAFKKVAVNGAQLVRHAFGASP
jgi:hypothetical protein